MASSSRAQVRSLVFGAWFTLAAACEQTDGTGLPGGAPFLEEDSAGVLVATTSGTQARTSIGWIVDIVPEYQVGKMEGEEPYLFTGIRGVRQLSDGRVLVLDEGTCEFRFFGAAGAYRRKRRGPRGVQAYRNRMRTGALARQRFATRL